MIPTHFLVCQGNITTPALNIALFENGEDWYQRATAECARLICALAGTEYTRFHLWANNADETQTLVADLRLNLTAPTVTITKDHRPLPM